jgi:beta-galactosidase
LPVNLTRGETPSTPSFTVTRTAIAIVSASAGVNADTAPNSYDDDETTAWTNASATRTDIYPDGLPIRNAKPDNNPVNASLDTAWIEYDLAQPTAPTELDLKLVAFRLRRYPIRITLDGATIYEGTTPTSLGYITLPLHATQPGTKLRIQLIASPIDIEETHSLVEVNGKIDQAEPKTKQARPVLSILEVEIYTNPLST